MQQWPIPINIKQLRGFLGLTGYYIKFVRNYASIAMQQWSLTELLKLNAFQWSNAAQAAFQEVKHDVVSTPVLALPNFDHPFVLETDASGRGIGAVLSQKNYPIAFFSRKLSTKMQLASTYAREMLAITEAVAHWRQYLLKLIKRALRNS